MHSKQAKALALLRTGFTVIGAKANTKRSRNQWKLWENNQTEQHIIEYWDKYPDDEPAILTDGKVVVLDCDTEESLVWLLDTLNQHDIESRYIVATKHGKHFYFRAPEGFEVKQRGYSSDKNPGCVDIKAGRSLVMAEGSTGKRLEHSSIGSVDDLSPLTPEFYDDLLAHNAEESGSLASPPVGNRSKERAESADQSSQKVDIASRLAEITSLLSRFPADEYHVWISTGMAIHFETEGSDSGRELWNDWSAGSDKYKSVKEIEYQWSKFNPSRAGGYTIGTIYHHAGVVGEQFQKVPKGEILATLASPLEVFSLRGKGDLLLNSVSDEKPLLFGLVQQGQATIFYAPPNSGKTLITLKGLIEDVLAGRLNPNWIYYCNFDDNQKGVATKVSITEEHDIHMLAAGQNDFSAGQLIKLLPALTTHQHVADHVIVIDTLARVVDIMNKGDANKLTGLLRAFVANGGTVIALAHTNKNRSKDNKPVYAGVSDFINDLDCAYTVDAVGDHPHDDCHVVTFSNQKNRGGVVDSKSFKFLKGEGLQYLDLLESVEVVLDAEVEAIAEHFQVENDAEHISLAKRLISEGINTRVALYKAIAKESSLSQRAAILVIDRYSGNDPGEHQWTESKGERGKKIYTLIDSEPMKAGDH